MRPQPPTSPTPKQKTPAVLPLRTSGQRTGRLAAELKSQTNGLLLLALGVLLFILWRAGFERVFTAGWWRLW